MPFLPNRLGLGRRYPRNSGGAWGSYIQCITTSGIYVTEGAKHFLIHVEALLKVKSCLPLSEWAT